MYLLGDSRARSTDNILIHNVFDTISQWRSGGGAGGGHLPPGAARRRAPPGGGRQNPAK